MNDIQVRVPIHLSSQLVDELQKALQHEPVVFALVSHAITKFRDLVLVRELLIPPESAFLPSRGHGARWSGKYMIDVLNHAVASQCGVFFFHSHGNGVSRMSVDDLASGRELLPKFQLVIPSRPHGSIVITDDSVSGLILMPGRDALSDSFSMRTFSGHMVTLPLPNDTPRETVRFKRQPLAVGTQVRKVLALCKIAVVGQSGGGTHVTQQLLQLDVGEIIGIDNDHMDEGNRFSGIGISRKDVANGRLKVDAMRRRARTIDGSRYRAVPAVVPEHRALCAIKEADIIVGCVNNLHARADIQEIALRYSIPYVDIGLAIPTRDDSMDEFPPIRAISGNVFTFIPGGLCLWCTEFLTDEKLAKETQYRGRPYLKTVDNVNALVVSFNGLLASLAVTEVLRLLTGFAEAAVSSYKKYDGLTGQLLPCNVAGNRRCVKCTSLLGAGDPVFKEL